MMIFLDVVGQADSGLFEDRYEVGRLLAKKLDKLDSDCMVMAIVRGGVPVAAEIANYLDAPMELILAHKLSAPHQPELGIGAISEDGEMILERSEIETLGIRPEDLNREIEKQKRQIEMRLWLFRQGKQLPSLVDKTVVLVDDGVAMGVTVAAAVKTLKNLGAARIILATGVISLRVKARLLRDVDEVVDLIEPEEMVAVGDYYKNFDQVTDEQVLEIMRVMSD